MSTDPKPAAEFDHLRAWGLGTPGGSRVALRALARIRAEAVRGIRRFLENENYVEVTTATLTQMTGSCENPATTFRVPYYGRMAYLAKSAQMQLEVLVEVMGRPVYTFTTSYRAEDYQADPGSGRRLSEFTLVEIECPGWDLDGMLRIEEELFTAAVRRVVGHASPEIEALGGEPARLASIRPPFPRITHTEAVALLVREGFVPPDPDPANWDFSIREECALVRHFGGHHLFVTHHPAAMKYFNMKRDNGKALSADLLAAPIGEVSGGGVRECDPGRAGDQLRASQMLRMIEARGGSASEFDWYLELLRDPGLPPRAGFGIGLERLVASLLGTDDILRCLEFPRTERLLFP
jgi:asparaginyl-tRNA synthetase